MDLFTKRCAILAGSLLTTAASADMIKIADSVVDFSGVQGGAGWSYGWYADNDVMLSGETGSVNTANFNSFSYYSAPNAWWTHDTNSATSGGGSSPFYLTVVTAELMHASAPIPGAGNVASDVLWASRRWTSDISGQIQILGHIAKFDQGAILGDGTEAYILVDGVAVYHRTVAGNDYVGIDYALDLQVNAGSVIEFVLGSNETGLNDATVFTSEILGNPVPTPGAIALMGVGGLLAGRRRRN